MQGDTDLQGEIKPLNDTPPRRPTSWNSEDDRFDDAIFRRLGEKQMSDKTVEHSYADLVRDHPKLAKVVCSSAWLIALAGETASPDEILKNFQTQYPPADDDLPRCCCAAWQIHRH